jgi:hypothetical protein
MKTKCYNGHILEADDDMVGMLGECPVCGEEFIIGNIELDNPPQKESEKYKTWLSLWNLMLGLVLLGLAEFLQIITGPFQGKFLLNIIYIPGVFFAIRGVILLTDNGDIWDIFKPIFLPFACLYKKLSKRKKVIKYKNNDFC